MKIKNNLVSIKIGKKQYDFRNLILDEYLKVFAKAQLSKDTIKNILNDKDICYLLIKFDTPLLNLNEKSVLKNEDFDIAVVFSASKIQTLSRNVITTQYTYTTGENEIIKDYRDIDTSKNHYINEYEGKKITALGFNSLWWDPQFIHNPVKAVLDTSNYNIYLQENQNFTVTRKDVITTEALFYSNDELKVPAPFHLAPVPPKAVLKPNQLYDDTGVYWIEGSNESYGIIHSVGVSNFVDRIDKEFTLGKDLEITQSGTELNIEGIENYLKNEKIYPNLSTYPNSNLYLMESNYKYIIIKYKVYQDVLSGSYENPINTMTDTGYFYHQAIPIDKFGKLNMKIKYERG